MAFPLHLAALPGANRLRPDPISPFILALLEWPPYQEFTACPYFATAHFFVWP